MKHYLPTLALITLIPALMPACTKKESDNTKNSPSYSSVGINYKSIISELQKRGTVTQISPELVLLSEIESNEDQPAQTRGPYQCTKKNTLIRLSDGKELDESDVFLPNSSEKLTSALLKYSKNNESAIGENNDQDLRGQINDAIKSISFDTVNQRDFNFISYEDISDSCQLKIFEKNPPATLLQPFLTDWMKKQLFG